MAFSQLALGDPTILIRRDEEVGQTIISGRDELQLDTIVDRLKHEYGVEANVSPPQVTYRETITRRVEHDYVHRQKSSGTSEFARIRFVVEPNRSGGFEFVSGVRCLELELAEPQTS